MPDITVVWSFRNRIVELERSIRTAHHTSPADVAFLLVDGGSSEETIRALRRITSDLLGRTIRVAESHRRTTIVEAWNLGVYLADSPSVVIASADTTFIRGGWIEAFRGAFAAGGRYVLMPNHALFGLTKAAVQRIGFFDEGFVNGPHFDCDYLIRASEAGVAPTWLQDGGFYDHGDPPEITRARLAGEVQDRLTMSDLTNERYFKAKWAGGWPGWEGAPDPMNLPHPPIRIDQVTRLRPEVDPHPRWRERLT